MADYGEWIQVVGSEPHNDDGTVMERSESGRPRLRTFYTQMRKEFTVVHEVYQDEKEEIFDFYEDHKTDAFTFDWQGDTPYTLYTVRFMGAPQERPIEGDGRSRITVRLVVV